MIQRVELNVPVKRAALSLQICTLIMIQLKPGPELGIHAFEEYVYGFNDNSNILHQ